MEQTTEFREITANSESQQPSLSFLLTFIRAPLKTVLFRDGGVSRVLKSSCIRPYTPVFRARLPCPHKKCLVFRGAHNMLPALYDKFQVLSHIPPWKEDSPIEDFTGGILWMLSLTCLLIACRYTSSR